MDGDRGRQGSLKPQAVSQLIAKPHALKIALVDVMAVGPVSQTGKEDRIDRVTDRADRAVAESKITAIDVDAAEQQWIGESWAIARGRRKCRTEIVVVEARVKAFVVVEFKAGYIMVGIQVFFAQHDGVGGSVADLIGNDFTSLEANAAAFADIYVELFMDCRPE